MSESTIPNQPTRDETVMELMELVEDSLAQAKQAYIELAEERQEKVRLEKVASEKEKIKKVNPDVIHKTVDLLVQRDIIDEEVREKFASDATSCPENVLILANKLIEISVPSYREGRGIPKTASTNTNKIPTADADGWDTVATDGA